MILEAGKLNNKKVVVEAKLKKFIKEEDVATSKTSVISVIPTVKNLKQNKKIKRKKRKKMKRSMPAFWQGLLTGATVFFSIILVVVLAVMFIVVPMVEKWLNSVGIPDFETVFTLLDDAKVSVKEVSSNLNESMTTKSFSSEKEELYRDVVDKVKLAGLDMFDGYEFNLSGLDDETEFEDIYLTDKELGAFILKAYTNFVSFLDMGLINELNINFRLCEIKLENKGSDDYNINLVAEVLAPNIRDQLGTLSILMPEKIFLVLNMDVKNVENGNLEFSNAKLSFNKYSDKSFETMFDIIMSLIRTRADVDESNGKFTVSSFAQLLTDALEDGINMGTESFGGSFNIVEGIDGYSEPVFRVSSN